MEGESKVAVEQVMGSPQSAASGTLPAREGEKKALGIEGVLFWREGVNNDGGAEYKSEQQSVLDA
jgi:hypothetical protein